MPAPPERGSAANPALPVMARVRVRFAKRGRLRFTSHRDVARTFERAVRRAGLPVAHSHGFSPHPRLSWVGAAPTGAASEAEYLEIGLTRRIEPDELVRDLDAALPDGIDVLRAVATRPGEAALADRIDASRWRIELPGAEPDQLARAVDALLVAGSVIVQRMTKNGPRPVDVRAVLVCAAVSAGEADPGVAGVAAETPGHPCAIISVVVRHSTPAARPDDVLSALDVVAGFRPPIPAKVTRMAQGLLDDRGHLTDPFDVHDAEHHAGRGSGMVPDASLGGSPRIAPRRGRGETG